MKKNNNKKVTATINTVKIEYRVYENETVETKTHYDYGKADDFTLEKVRKLFENEERKVIDIVSIKEEAQLYMVNMIDFITKAKVYDKRPIGKNVITRTIKESTVVCTAFNYNELTTVGFIEYGEKSDITLEEARKAYETDDTKIIKIDYVHVNEHLYGMSYSDFVSLAE